MSAGSASRRTTQASVCRALRTANTAPPSTWASICSVGRVRRAVRGEHQVVGQPGQPPGPLRVLVARRDQAARGVEQHGRAHVRRHLHEPRRSAVGEGLGAVPASGAHNSRVPLQRISWMVTVGICLIAALLLLINGYSGYFGVLLAVGAAAAVNLR